MAPRTSCRPLLCAAFLFYLLATATAAPRPMTREEKTEIMLKRKRRAQETRRRRMSQRSAAGGAPGANAPGSTPLPAAHLDDGDGYGPETVDAREAIRDAKRDKFREQHVKFMARFDHEALIDNPDGTRRKPRKDFINPAYREEYEAGLGRRPKTKHGEGPWAETRPPIDAGREAEEMGRVGEQKYKKMQKHRERHKRRMDVHRRRIAEMKKARHRAMARRTQRTQKPAKPVQHAPQTRPATVGAGEEL